ncbi:CAP domain-containing protein [Salipaludibacillus sp. CF4.18]|uniref:CAP domain-containing protein n=1 Tax=Salipaludibacillus sp. CF4.18 TaxID=3373081 RepID=UPI003EE4CBBA
MKKRILLLLSLCFILMTVACGDNNMNNAYEGQRQSLQGQHMKNGLQTREDDNLSSIKTDMSSSEYPHTKSFQVQEAEFDFEIDEKQSHPEALYHGNFPLEGIPNLNEFFPREGFPDLNIQQPSPDQEQPAPEQTRPEPEPEQADQGQPKQEQRQQPDQGQPSQQPQQPEQAQQPDTTQGGNQGTQQEEQQVIDLTNQQRRENGLSDLQADDALSNVARAKSTDMQQNNYFSHTSPTYGSPFDMMRDFDINYSSAGENIAQGQRSPQEVVQAWMDSPGHRENILNGTYTHIGVGYDPNGNHWTQMFISK